MLISLIENLQREDLNSIDRTEGIEALKVNPGLPWTEVGKKLGLSKKRYWTWWDFWVFRMK